MFPRSITQVNPLTHGANAKNRQLLLKKKAVKTGLAANTDVVGVVVVRRAVLKMDLKNTAMELV